MHFAGVAPDGNFVAPHIFELADAGQLTEEVFGPILHVVRYRADRLERVLQSIERSGYGLTLGIHSRIDDTVEAVIDAASGRQHLCQPQHDRRRGRRAAVRRPRPVRHRPQGRRPALSGALCHRADGDRSTPRPPAAMPRCCRIRSEASLRLETCAMCICASTSSMAVKCAVANIGQIRRSLISDNSTRGTKPTKSRERRHHGKGHFRRPQGSGLREFHRSACGRHRAVGFRRRRDQDRTARRRRSLPQPAEFAGLSRTASTISRGCWKPATRGASRSTSPSRRARRCCIGSPPRPTSSSPIFRRRCASGSASPTSTSRRSTSG